MLASLLLSIFCRYSSQFLLKGSTEVDLVDKIKTHKAGPNEYMPRTRQISVQIILFDRRIKYIMLPFLQGYQSILFLYYENIKV